MAVLALTFAGKHDRFTTDTAANKASPAQDGGYFERLTFKLDGDNLWITGVENPGYRQIPSPP